MPRRQTRRHATQRRQTHRRGRSGDIDTGFAALLMLLTAVDAGLGACLFGIPADRVDGYREAFGVRSAFRPIGAISIGYSDEPPRDLNGRRRPAADVVHRNRWTTHAAG